MKLAIYNRFLFLLDQLIRAMMIVRNRLGQQKHLERATELDVFNAYRLFFNRLPDQEGAQHYLDLVRHHHISIDYLSDSFLYSPELQKIQDKRNQPELVQLPTFQLYVRLNDSFIGGAIAREKRYEAHVTQVLQELVKPGMVFLDIGANIGYFSMLAATLVGEKGQVISFEPVPANCELFRQSVAINQFKQVMLYPHAVADREQQLSLDIGGKNSNSRVVDVKEGEGNRPIIRAVQLDQFLTELTQLDVIKIDIEGAEPLALTGMRQILTRFRPIIALEYSPDLIKVTSQSDPLQFLRDLAQMGYTLHHIPNVLHQSVTTLAPQTPEKLFALCGALSAYDHIDLLALPQTR